MFVLLDLLPDVGDDVLDGVEVGALTDEHVLDVLHSLSVLLVEVLERIHHVQVLERHQRVLEDFEVE